MSEIQTSPPGDRATVSVQIRATPEAAFRAFPAAAEEPVEIVPAGEPDRFRLEGVSLAEGTERRHAILNDRVVRVGDEVNGHRVVAIERGRVVLESGGRRTEISIRWEKSE